MSEFVVDYTELVGGKLKKANGFSKPNFGVGPNSEPINSLDELAFRHAQAELSFGMTD